jgi:hypothetical protein
MTQNPVIEKLVQGTIERCRERIAASRERKARVRNGWPITGGSSFTSQIKQSHGL